MKYVTIKDDNDKVNRALKELKKLKGSKIKVGVIGENEQEDEVDLVTIASVHEFGISIDVTQEMRNWFLWKGFPLRSETTQIEIPERSFIRTAFDNNEKDIQNKARQLYTQVVKGRMTAELMMSKLGLWCVNLVRQQINEVETPPLSGMTTKLRTGTGEQSPLQDTGQLWESIQYEVEW